MSEKSEKIINLIDYVLNLINDDEKKLSAMSDHLIRSKYCLKAIKEELGKEGVEI